MLINHIINNILFLQYSEPYECKKQKIYNSADYRIVAPQYLGYSISVLYWNTSFD